MNHLVKEYELLYRLVLSLAYVNIFQMQREGVPCGFKELEGLID